jgi:[ribosomal protein S5]-alanine N-acetyltransferase
MSACPPLRTLGEWWTLKGMDLTRNCLETERLLLVPKSRAHAAFILPEYREPVTRYLAHPPPASLDLLREQIEYQRAAMETGKALFWAGFLKGSQEFIGCFSLENIGSAHPEMGGWVKESAQGNLYGREAADEIKRWANKHLDHQYLVWPCAVENRASRTLAQALGGQVHRTYRKRTSAEVEMTYAEYRIARESD